MPDILIRGMEMPQNCLYCPCSFWDERTLALWCHALSIYDDNLVAENVTAIEAHGGNTSKVKRPDFCPLHELPPHGDLISKQTALAALYSDYAYAAMDIIEKEVPVVIPAERREEDEKI